MAGLLWLLTGAGAYAAGVPVRAGEHDDYSRLVFDWQKPAPYELKKEGADTLVLVFSAASDIAVESLDVDKIKNLSKVSDSVEGSKTFVRMTIPADSRYRHFTMGNRVIVDIYDPPGSAKPKKQAAPAKKTPPPEPESVKKKPQDEPEKMTAAHPEEPDEEELSPEMPAIPADNVIVDELKAPSAHAELEKAKADLESYLFTMTLTENTGMAAFSRAGALWMVFDRAGINVMPQISGPRSEMFGDFEKVPMKGGTAFRLKLPEETRAWHMYGEGGGLVWRVVLTKTERKTSPVEPERSFIREDEIWGGTLTWPLQRARDLLELRDPTVGDTIKLVTVSDAGQFTGQAYDFVEFNVLPSMVGMALLPKVDDLEIMPGGGVKMTRPGGLAISRARDISRHQMREEIVDNNIGQIMKPAENVRRIFDFDRWMLGGLNALDENQAILLSGMAAKDTNGRVQDLLTLAKINVANDRGQEAVGFLRYAAQEMPEIIKSPEYLALRGAAFALAGKYEMAFRDLMRPVLMEYGELDYWRAYTLAWLEDWNQAEKILPQTFGIILEYPKALQEKLGLKLAEIELRSANVDTAEAVLAVLHKEEEKLRPSTVAGLKYLKGEAHRQSGEYDQARKWWEPLAKGNDDLYRVKAGLALTIMAMQDEKFDQHEEAINRLEGLRYAWRGDELEAKINFVLGQLYLKSRRYLKGLGILREAAAMSPQSDIGREITAYMKSYFQDLLLNDEEIAPLDAAAVYEEFIELTPDGDTGNKLIQKLSERLVEADLLGRAAAMLQHQVDFRLQGAEKAAVAKRLAAIYLLDKEPKKAIKAIDAAIPYHEASTDEGKDVALEELGLLRARAYSQLGRTEEAIALLNDYDPDPKVNSMRADLAWRAGLWEDAAEALQDLIIDEALDPGRPLTNKQADLILNRAVALNLSGNRVALANIRKRYDDAMKKTPRGRLFDVVTRARNTSMLADKDTINELVSEVDIFQDFLESYRDSQ
ncbi:MAG: hypothetical protein H6868_05350 [Rhodospirillales bacterium]|nr:hypothetical protein [Rhodospirillales bacterium]